ncbi:MAG TPA: putative peptidoglycan glycosyltransferase FtsW [Candidatus Dormibacteraeota bacterium]|nr:putative peptidoglycan glycosyltransferase FtsW [Candidatus Dormibacteraeota bacterium]HVD02634.1 putative peptidoglycan glycosyltransferase FtsW [Candidatus Dormibacteraeota bacterium]
MIARVERWIPAASTHRGGGARARESRLPDCDVWLLLVTTALCGLGLVMVYVASEGFAYTWYNGNAAYFFEHQVVWLALGTSALVVCLRMDYHHWRTFGPWLGALSVFLLVAVLVPHIGIQVLGARRWIGAGPIQIQPSVIAQFMIVVEGAVWLDQHRRVMGDLHQGVLPYAWRIGVLAILVVAEKDLGSTMVLTLLGLGLLVLAGVRTRYLAALVGLGAVFGALLIKAEPYRVARLLAYLNPFAHPQTTGFQAVQALYAFGSGGLFGTGFSSPVPTSQSLPEAQNDFIFAVIGQDLGLLGTLAVLALFGAFAWRGYKIARNAPDHLGVLLAGGATIWIVGQALINIGGVTDTIPSTGVPLTFISYGGSSMALSLAATGILLNISARRRRTGGSNARSDHGRRDGRPLHSGVGRRRGAEPN